MGKRIDRQLSSGVASDSSAIEGCCILGREFALEQTELSLAEGFGFGFAGGQVVVKLLHHQGGAGIVDIPKGCLNGSHALPEEEIANARNFHTFTGAA
jgi:hypothetical protein